jgi:hypothetical protein
MPQPLRVDLSAAEQEMDSEPTSLEFEVGPPSLPLLQRMPQPLQEPRALRFTDRGWSSPTWGPPQRGVAAVLALP